MAETTTYGELIPTGGGDPIPLLKTRLLVGRRSRCDIVLDYPNVSSQHSELELINGYWHVRDLGSQNGTKVNGDRVAERFLKPGDELAFARYRFEVCYTPDPTAPPPPIEDNPFEHSLMEKAGLERRRPDRPKTAPAAPKSLPKKPSHLKDDDDKALEWLSGE